MMALWPAEYHSISLIGIANAWIILGGLIGLLHFRILQWSISRLIDGQIFALAFAIQFVRFALTAAILVIITCYFGVMPLLVTTAGILAARTIIVRLGVRT